MDLSSLKRSGMCEKKTRKKSFVYTVFTCHRLNYFPTYMLVNRAPNEYGSALFIVISGVGTQSRIISTFQLLTGPVSQNFYELQ